MELIYDPSEHEGPMNIVAWGSGSCSTIEAIIKNQKREMTSQLYKVVALVTDNMDSKAHTIGKRENIPVIYNDFHGFVRECGLDPAKKKDRKNEGMRTEYDKKTLQMLLDASEKNGFYTDINCLAGYMLKQYPPIIGAYPGRIINSHPADLSIPDENGKRKYTGDNAVLDAIVAGESSTRTSIHVVREDVDDGEILVLSGPLQVPQKALDFMAEFVKLATDDFRKALLEKYYESRRLKKELRRFSDEDIRRYLVTSMTSQSHQELQKIRCDYPAYLFAIEEIAKGNFALESSGSERMDVYYKGEKMPYYGVVL